MELESRRIWIDVINPSDAFFFGALLPELSACDTQITLRRRAETEALSLRLGMNGTVVGTHQKEPVMKPFATLTRFVKLNSVLDDFDYGLSFENPVSVALCRLKCKRSLLFCDNDLKLEGRRNFLQRADNMFRLDADVVFIPIACESTFSRVMRHNRIVTYNGYKEDIYVSRYKPDEDFLKILGVSNYVTVRPEAFGSTYVREDRSIVPRLLSLLTREGHNVVYLPRDRNDIAYSKGVDVIVPEAPLNGLDLSYHADAVLTGSGTMAREAACLHRPAVSFFPNETLLSVDRKLAEEGRVLHSRDPDEIVRYVSSSRGTSRQPRFDSSKEVMRELTELLISTLAESA